MYYLDTEDRVLQHHGVVVRVRSIKRRPDDSVIKLRPVSPGGIPEALRQSRQFVVEVDATPGSYVCSGALRGAGKSQARSSGTKAPVPSSAEW